MMIQLTMYRIGCFEDDQSALHIPTVVVDGGTVANVHGIIPVAMPMCSVHLVYQTMIDIQNVAPNNLNRMNSMQTLPTL
jgi:hypothetical protein